MMKKYILIFISLSGEDIYYLKFILFIVIELFFTFFAIALVIEKNHKNGE